ncbi:MAG: tryptophan-rich sensory protein [Bacteroidetes bacterium]|nr:tryptophan-rich sensory protein [Bacteroidota bacterium]MCH8523635.1 tryptophan-rich sensory protein [Balneolales bacterium]
MNKLKESAIFIGFLVLPLLIGVTASVATASGVSTWYVTLEKPFFNPPNWIFGPVWTVLYLLMGVSSYLVYRSPHSGNRRLGLDVYGVMLALNFAWSFLFFYFQRPGLAFIEIIVLWLSIFAMIVFFYRVRPLAGLLQLPYIAWVSFATVLNGAIWWLN